jgi:hypothetical protein
VHTKMYPLHLQGPIQQTNTPCHTVCLWRKHEGNGGRINWAQKSAYMLLIPCGSTAASMYTT